MALSNKQLFYFISISLLFIIFSYFYLDASIAHYFITHKQKYLTLGNILSIGGQSKWYIGVSIIGILIYKFYKKNNLYLQRYFFVLYANIFSAFVALIIKIIIGRVRPWGIENGGHQYGIFELFSHITPTLLKHHHLKEIIHQLNTYVSFPSGHAVTAFAMFTYMSILFPRFRYIWLFIALLVGISRIFADDHYLSDIVGGAMVGIISTIFIYRLMKEKLQA